MTAPSAPYHDDVAAPVAGAGAFWVAASDGMRVRVGVWPEGTRGTVLIVPGRTEYIEKYSDAAAQMQARGFACAAIDVRGQGLSPRPSPNRMIGHVNDFSDFQLDVDAMIALCSEMELPRPWHILGHSMGGLIALRTLLRRPETFRRAVFSAPMWGLQLHVHRRFMAWTISALAANIGMGEKAAPSTGKVANPAAALFDQNLLTRDPEMFAWMKKQITTYPELALGGPSLGWLWAALREMHACARLAAPAVPTLTFLGTDESIVSPDAIHVRMASWDAGDVQIIEGARHEALMERTDVRVAIYDQIAAHMNG